MNQKNSSVPEKKINRYVFVCIGLIMYLMPCLACLCPVMMAEGVTAAGVLAIAAEVLAVPLGLLGINAMKKPKLRLWCIVYAAVLMVLHAVCAVMIGAWYVIMVPTLVLMVLFIPWSAVVWEMNK